MNAKSAVATFVLVVLFSDFCSAQVGNNPPTQNGPPSGNPALYLFRYDRQYATPPTNAPATQPQTIVNGKFVVVVGDAVPPYPVNLRLYKSTPKEGAPGEYYWKQLAVTRWVKKRAANPSRSEYSCVVPHKPGYYQVRVSWMGKNGYSRLETIAP